MDFKYIINNSLSIMILRGLGLLLGLIINFLIVNLIGINELGIYSLAITITNFIVIFTVLGLDTYLLREISHFYQDRKYIEVKSILRTTGYIIITSSLITFLISILLINSSFFYNQEKLKEYLLVFSFGIIVLSFHKVFFVTLRSLDYIILSVLTDATIPKILLVILIYLSSTTINIPLPFLHIFSYFFSIIFIWLIIRKKYSIRRIKESPVQKKKTPVIYESYPMMFNASIGFLFLNMDILMIGFLLNSENVGQYTIISQLVMIVSFFLIAMTSFVTPDFSKLYKSGKLADLIIYYKKSSILSFITSLVAALVILLLGSYILTIFNITGAIPYYTLTILILSQVIRSYFGLLGQLLNMIGLQRKLLKAMIISILLNILFNFLLIPKFGIMGAAIATTLSLLTRDAISFFYYYKFKNKIQMHNLS